MKTEDLIRYLISSVEDVKLEIPETVRQLLLREQMSAFTYIVLGIVLIGLNIKLFREYQKSDKNNYLNYDKEIFWFTGIGITLIGYVFLAHNIFKLFEIYYTPRIVLIDLISRIK